MNANSMKRRQNDYQIGAALQEAERDKLELKIVERTILTCEVAKRVIDKGVFNYLESLKDKPKSKYEYNRERKRDFRVGKKKVEYKPLFYLDPEDDAPKKGEEVQEAKESEKESEVVLTAENLKEYNKNKKRDFSLAKTHPTRRTAKQEKESEPKPEVYSLEALSAKQEQSEKEKSEKELEESIAKTKYQHNQERKRNFTFGKVSLTAKEDPLLAALKKKQRETIQLQISPFPEVMIDPNNFLRPYKYENFQETIKYLQHYQYHLQWQNILRLDLSNQALEDSHMDLFCATVKQQQALQQLNLSNNLITDKGIYSFSQIIRSLPKLRQLNLSWNKFTDYGIKLLTDPQYYSTSIEEYNLSYNVLTTLAAYFLCLWYTKDYHCRVKKLILGGLIHYTHTHYWGNAFLQLFIGQLLSLEINRLEELVLYPFNLTEEGFDCLLLLLFANHNSLRILNISHNFIYNYSYRQFFIQIIQFLTQRNRDYAEATFEFGAQRRSFQLLAYDCGFSLEEIQYFQELFIESEGVQRQYYQPMMMKAKTTRGSVSVPPSRRSSATTKAGESKPSTVAASPALPLRRSITTPSVLSMISRQSNLSTAIFVPSAQQDHKRSVFSLQQYSTIQWKSLLMLAGRLHAIYYHCLFAIYQMKTKLINNWKLKVPMKYRPPVVLTSLNASKYKVIRVRASTVPRVGSPSFRDKLLASVSIEELIPMKPSEMVGSTNSGFVEGEKGEGSEKEDEEDDFNQRFFDNSDASSSIVHNDTTLTTITAAPPVDRPPATTIATLPVIHSTVQEKSVTVTLSPSKKAANPLQENSLANKETSQVTESSGNETYIYENDQSLLANLTKRLLFPLELLFQGRNAPLAILKASIIGLNDELNYVHFYQELIGQLNTIQFTASFTRSKDELRQLYHDLETYNQLVWYTSIHAMANAASNVHEPTLDRVVEDEEVDSVTVSGSATVTDQSSSQAPFFTAKGGGPPISQTLQPQESTIFPNPASSSRRSVFKHQSSKGQLKSQASTSSLVFNLSKQSSCAELFKRPNKLPDRVFSEDMVEQQILFFQYLKEKAIYYLTKWSQAIDECLEQLEDYCNDIYQQNLSGLYPALASSLKRQQRMSAANGPPRITIMKQKKRNPKEKVIQVENVQQLEQMLFAIEDCYSHTIRLGMIDEEYIGCLYQQNLIHEYITRKQTIIQTFRQREEEEAFELEQQAQAKLAKQQSRRSKSSSSAKDPPAAEELLITPGQSQRESAILTTKSKYHLKHHLHDVKKLIHEDEQQLYFLSLSFLQYLHGELNMNFENALSYLSYFYHYYCFIYQKEKYKI